MSTPKYDEAGLKHAAHLLGYFDQQVLAAYRNESQKYKVESDDFNGKLTVTDEFYEELVENGKTNEYINIRFGYRTLRDGNTAVVAWLPDLVKRSETHFQKWSAFHLKDPEWLTGDDERFRKWVQRYLEGSWEVESGPIYHLEETIKVINGLTSELVEAPLYKHKIDSTLGNPAAENTHCYQDSHQKLYGYLIDDLDKDCISSLASSLGKNIKVGDKNTIQGIKALFPDLDTTPNFTRAMNLVSQQRRLASHGVRPPAEKFPAFSQFTEDLSLCVEAVKELLAMLERDFGVRGEEAYKRNEAKRWLPTIDRPAEPHYSIV